MGADCKSAGSAYAGSNPARPKQKKISFADLMKNSQESNCLVFWHKKSMKPKNIQLLQKKL